MGIFAVGVLHFGMAESKPFAFFLKINLFNMRQRIIVSFPQSLISLLLVLSTLFYCSFLVVGESKLVFFLFILFEFKVPGSAPALLFLCFLLV